MLIRSRNPWDVIDYKTTDENVYLNRRSLLRAMGIAGGWARKLICCGRIFCASGIISQGRVNYRFSGDAQPGLYARQTRHRRRRSHHLYQFLRIWVLEEHLAKSPEASHRSVDIHHRRDGG